MRNLKGKCEKTKKVAVLHSEKLKTASNLGGGVGKVGRVWAELQMLKTLLSFSSPLSELSASPQSPPKSERKPRQLDWELLCPWLP